MAISQTNDELETHLLEQIDFLKAACDSFDEGKTSFAKVAATSLRVLMHDTRQSSSLLGLLGLKSSLKLLDTAGQMLDVNLASSSNLTIQRLTVVDDEGNVEPSYVPVLDDYHHRSTLNRQTAFGVVRQPAAGRRLPFEEWWTMPVIRDGSRTDFSRRDLVLALSNKDGGAHVDPSIGDAYHRLSRANSVGWIAQGGGTEVAFGSPVLASVRQIAYEFLNSAPPDRGTLQRRRAGQI